MNFNDILIPTARAQLDLDYDAMSRAERAWSDEGYKCLNGGNCHVMLYEWVTFKLPGGSYTPDFLMISEAGRMTFIEIKETRFQGSYRDSRSKLRAVASMNPWFRFVMAVYQKKSGETSWIIEEIEPDHAGWRNGVYMRGAQKPRTVRHRPIRKKRKVTNGKV